MGEEAGILGFGYGAHGAKVLGGRGVSTVTASASTLLVAHETARLKADSATRGNFGRSMMSRAACSLCTGHAFCVRQLDAAPSVVLAIHRGLAGPRGCCGCGCLVLLLLLLLPLLWFGRITQSRWERYMATSQSHAYEGNYRTAAVDACTVLFEHMD